MKNNKAIQLVTGLMLSFLAACGNDYDPNYRGPVDPRTGLYGYGGGYGACMIPPAKHFRSVVGDLGYGATLKLDLSYDQAGMIVAIGELNIPSMSAFAGIPGFTNPNPYGGMSGDQLVSCVSSNGTPGQAMDPNSTWERLELTLRGEGIFIMMGSQFNIDTYMQGNRIMGQMSIEIGGQVYPVTSQ